MRMAPRTDCSASRLWGGRRSITARADSDGELGASLSGDDGHQRYTNTDLPASPAPLNHRACGRDVDDNVDIHPVTSAVARPGGRRTVESSRIGRGAWPW